jgi:hypothetical protein
MKGDGEIDPIERIHAPDQFYWQLRFGTQF